MTVYVDLLFGLNMVINYLMLRGSAALSGVPVTLWRLLAAAGLGGVYAVVTVVPGLAFLQEWIFQMLCAGLMLLIAFGLKRNTVKQGLFFFALSFAFGGAVLLLVQAVEPDFVLLGGRAYYAVSIPAMLLLAGVCYAVAAVVLKGCGTHTGGDVIDAELILGQRRLSVKALRDTGNTLRDPISGNAVMVVDGQMLVKLFPDLSITRKQMEDPVSLMECLSARYPKCRFCLICYHAVGVQSGLLLAVRCRGRIGKCVQPMLAAFSPVELGDTFHALWGGAVQ